MTNKPTSNGQEMTVIRAFDLALRTLDEMAKASGQTRGALIAEALGSVMDTYEDDWYKLKAKNDGNALLRPAHINILRVLKRLGPNGEMITNDILYGDPSYPSGGHRDAYRAQLRRWGFITSNNNRGSWGLTDKGITADVTPKEGTA